MVVSVGEVNTIAKRKGRDRKCWEKYIIKQEGRLEVGNFREIQTIAGRKAWIG